MLRLRITIRGAVQGVGFRPFIFRLATELGLKGWVNNSAQGVFIEVEGLPAALQQFLLRISAEKPPRSSIQSLESSWLDPVGYTQFDIRASEPGGPKTALVLPDIATCPDCLSEILDPQNRRYFYPFTNCTNCGPRFSIIEGLPYDRVNTSMKAFTMCPQCQAEYDDPRDRRFHAQPNACPVCGPQLELWDEHGHPVASAAGSRAALQQTADSIRAGKIVAVKGLGGFHLMVDAANDDAVRRLRERKHREEKPFALMFPSLELIKANCEVSLLEERLLTSPESPIVLLNRHSATSGFTFHVSRFTSLIAPNNPYLGVMLPYTPLHHLLLSLLGLPVVATSGNLSDEPICTDERDAVHRLQGIAELFLVHNRPIVRHVDDSIVRVMAGRELVSRRARGFAPLPIQLRSAECGVRSVLAVGAHLKNTVTLSVGSQAFISQHIGDLETDAAYEAFRRVIADFEKLYETRPVLIVADAHPDYLSTQYARAAVSHWPQTSASRPAGHCNASVASVAEQACSPAGSGGAPAASSNPAGSLPAPLALIQSAGPYISVQHHLAHVLSCLAENELEPPLLGVSWDGTGYGLDGTVWGGEFFDCSCRGEDCSCRRKEAGSAGWVDSDSDPACLRGQLRSSDPASLRRQLQCHRLAHFRQFCLPGGEQAIKEPRRSALGLLYAMYGDSVFSRDDLHPLRAFSSAELASLQTMLESGLNSPLTSSVGRLFDAVASIVGLRQQTRYEGQAAMELEFALEHPETEPAYEITLLPSDASGSKLDAPLNVLGAGTSSSPATRNPGSTAGCADVPAPDPHTVEIPMTLCIDWSLLVESLLSDLRAGAATAQISARFHNALVEAIVAVARRVGHAQVCLSGGCFQNRYLTERAVSRLRTEGFRPYWHQRVPPNDGGIALGQIVAALTLSR